LEKGLRAYKDINLLAIKLLAPGGILATFSCSGPRHAGRVPDGDRLGGVGQRAHGEDPGVAGPAARPSGAGGLPRVGISQGPDLPGGRLRPEAGRGGTISWACDTDDIIGAGGNSRASGIRSPRARRRPPAGRCRCPGRSGHPPALSRGRRLLAAGALRRVARARGPADRRAHPPGALLERLAHRVRRQLRVVERSLPVPWRGHPRAGAAAVPPGKGQIAAHGTRPPPPRRGARGRRGIGRQAPSRGPARGALPSYDPPSPLDVRIRCSLTRSSKCVHFFVDTWR